MSSANVLGFRRSGLSSAEAPRTEYVLIQRPLDRILSFMGRSINDVVNCPMVKNQVVIYYKLHKWVDRESEISEMERAWNPLGRRV